MTWKLRLGKQINEGDDIIMNKSSFLDNINIDFNDKYINYINNIIFYYDVSNVNGIGVFTFKNLNVSLWVLIKKWVLHFPY